MKTTIDIPREELVEAMKHTGAKTKREAVVTALTDFNRRKRREALIKLFGTFEDFMTPDELRRMRELPAMDLLIAACARVHGLDLVHRDEHFDRLERLVVDAG